MSEKESELNQDQNMGKNKNHVINRTQLSEQWLTK